MSTTSETLQALYSLQQIDTQLSRAKKAQSALDNGTAAAALADTARSQEQQRRSTWHKFSGDLKDSELKLAAIETKRKNYQQKLYQGTVTNPKELANIEKEIEALGRQQSDLDGRVLELMDEAEQAQSALTVAEEQARQAEGHRTDTLAAYRSRHEALDLELSSLAQQRKNAAMLVEDKAALKRYEDIRAKSGGIGIAKIEGNTCGGCHMTLPAVLIKSVKEQPQVQTCENCGRLLMA